MPRTALLLMLAAAARTDLPRGQVIDPVLSLADPAQSYALYLPCRYDEGRDWPILYCFDPRGRGAVPVGLFKAVAERFGWIVAGSNNSRNGPWETILAAARVLWRDTRARLRIDERRVYAAGFSGGARVASALASMLSIRPAGVIGCGGGLPEWLEPGDVAATPWFGLVGMSDFNFPEMQELAGKLRQQGTACRLRVFQGRHEWPPASLINEAVAWLNEIDAAPRPLKTVDFRLPGWYGRKGAGEQR